MSRSREIGSVKDAHGLNVETEFVWQHGFVREGVLRIGRIEATFDLTDEDGRIALRRVIWDLEALLAMDVA